MGLVFSNEEGAERSKQIQKMLDRAAVKENTTIKLALLGTGDSGKSTVMKQIRQNLDSGYTQYHLNQQVTGIKNMITGNMKLLIGDLFSSEEVLSEQERETFEEALAFANKNPPKVKSDEAQLLLRVWNNPTTQKFWHQSTKSRYSESLEHFLTEAALNRLVGYSKGSLKNPKRILTNDQLLDLLYLRSPTSGGYSASFFHKERLIQIYDFGGQRSERKKWIPLLTGTVTTIVYVVAISEFNQVLFERDAGARMKESLNVWDALVNDKHLYDTSFLLFLNKYDLFRSKVCEIPFKLKEEDVPEGSSDLARNEDYEGREPKDFPPGEEQEEAILECIDYLKQKFFECVPALVSYRSFNSKVTTATNIQSMAVVLESIKDQLLKAEMARHGFFV